MPKFAPNTGFKMPGIGSKNIDSPGNFRDEQHVDKVGYCDTTEDSMLPEGSSPLKARYTTTGYRKDIKELDVPQGRVSPEDDVYEKTETITEGGDENSGGKSNISTRSKIVEATPDVPATAYETARQRLLADPAKLKAWETEYGKADPKNFKTQTDNWNTENNTTTARKGLPGSENYYKTVDKGDETEIAKEEFEKLNKGR